MADIKGQVGEMRATIHVTRKETGKVDSFEIIGHQDPEKLKQILAELNNKPKEQ